MVALFGLAAASGIAVGTDVDDDEIVVTFDDEIQIGDTADTDDLPASPYVSAGGDRVIVVDDQLETTSGEQIVVDENPVTVDRSADPEIVFDFDGSVDTLALSDGDIVADSDSDVPAETTDGESVTFPGYDDARFEVELTDVDDDIGEGADLDLEAQFTKLEYADLSESVNVTLLDDDRAEISNQSFEVDLADRETTESFSYETDAGDAEATELELELPGSGSEFAPVTIEESKWYVTFDSAVTDQTPAVGENITVDAEVERRGSLTETGAGTVAFEVWDGSQYDHVDQRTFELDEGETESLSFEYETREGDQPELDVRVESDDHANETTVSVIGQQTLEENVDVEIVDWNRPEVGEDLEITGEISYADPRLIPDEPQEYPVNLTIGEEVVDERTVELDGRETVTETFTYETIPDDTPRVEAALEGPVETDHLQPRVIGSGFEVSIVEFTEPVNESETFTAIVQITNTGETSDTQTIELAVDDALSDPSTPTDGVVDDELVSLRVGESTTERFTYRTDGDDVPETDVLVQSDDDEAIELVTVRGQSSWFTPTDLEGTESDDQLELSSIVMNEGLTSDDQYVEFHVDDEVVHIDRLDLEPWQERRVETAVDLPEQESVDVAVVTANETTEETLDLEQPSSEPESTADNESDTDDEAGTDADDDSVTDGTVLPSLPSVSPGLPSLGQLGVGLGGLLGIAVAVFLYRRGINRPSLDGVTARVRGVPAAVSPKARRLVPAGQSADLGGLVGSVTQLVPLGSNTLYVRNELPRAVDVVVHCETADETVVETELSLDPDDQETVGSLPDADQYRVGAGVDEVTHEERFQGVDADVGVVLKPEGILISKL